MHVSSGLMQKITTPVSHCWVSLALWLFCAPCCSRSHRQACGYEASEKNPAIEEETCNFLSGCNYICFWVSVSYERLIYELRLAAVSGASQTCSDITQRQRPDTNTLASGTQTAWGTLWVKSDSYAPALRRAGANQYRWNKTQKTNILSFSYFLPNDVWLLSSIRSTNSHHDLHESWEKTQG